MASVGLLPKVVATCFGMDSMLKNKQECHEFTKVFLCLAEVAGVSARRNSAYQLRDRLIGTAKRDDAAYATSS